MVQDWTANIPTVVYFVVGLGGVAGALLAMLKLKEAVVPDANSQVTKDIATIRADIHDIRARVGMLELDVARIDQPSIAKRFDALEGKIDKLYDFLLERLTKLPSSVARQRTSPSTTDSIHQRSRRPKRLRP